MATVDIETKRAAGYTLLGQLAETLNHIASNINRLVDYPLVLGEVNRLRLLVISHLGDIGDPAKWHDAADVPNIDLAYRLSPSERIEDMLRCPSRHQKRISEELS